MKLDGQTPKMRRKGRQAGISKYFNTLKQKGPHLARMYVFQWKEDSFRGKGTEVQSPAEIGPASSCPCTSFDHINMMCTALSITTTVKDFDKKIAQCTCVSILIPLSLFYGNLQLAPFHK